MNKERIEELVEIAAQAVDASEIRAVLLACALECFEEAAKVCEDGVRDGPLSPAERYRSGFIRDAIRSLAEEVGK